MFWEVLRSFRKYIWSRWEFLKVNQFAVFSFLGLF
nr:MAG TPA: hypothetical protein [Caudoviricetes sp.]